MLSDLQTATDATTVNKNWCKWLESDPRATTTFIEARVLAPRFYFVI